MSMAGLTVTEINSTSEFARLEPEWNRLLSASESDNIFLTFDWLSTWLQMLGDQCDLMLLLVKSGDQLIGAAPLMIMTRGRLLKTRVVTFVGAGLSDYADVLIAERKSDVAAAIVRHLQEQSRRWHVVDLREIPGQSSSLGLLRAAARKAGFPVDSRVTHRCWWVPTGDWSTYRSGLSKKLRREVANGSNRLGKLGQLRYARILEPTPELGRLLGEALDLYERRLLAKGETGGLMETRKRAFVEKVAARLSEKGWLDLLLLELDDKTIAYALNFVYKGKLYGWNTAFDPDYARCSPGTVLLNHLLEDSFKRDLREVDFLRGDREYKRRWGVSYRESFQLVMASRRPRSRAAFLWLTTIRQPVSK